MRWTIPLLLTSTLVGCDGLGDKLPINLPPALLEADPPEGETLTLDKNGIAVYIVVTDEEPETLTESWFLVSSDGTETPLEGEPFSPSYENAGDNYALFAQSFSLLSLEDGAELLVVVTDIEGDTLSVAWPLAATE